MIQTTTRKGWCCKRCGEPITIIYTDKYKDGSDWIATYCKCAFSYKPGVTAEEVIFDDADKPMKVYEVAEQIDKDEKLAEMWYNEQFCMIGGG